MQVYESVLFTVINCSEMFKYEIELASREINLHTSQIIAISSLINRDGVTQAELAKRLNVSPPSVNKTVCLLKKNKFLVVKSCSKDSRASRIFLTEKAKKLFPQITAMLREREAKFFVNFSETEKLLFIHLLEKVNLD